MSTGRLITLYGVNNIGKSTHARLLVEHLRAEGRRVEYLKYPIYDLVPTGIRLNEILRGSSEQTVSEEELQTLFMQNRKDFEPTLKKMLDEGAIVIAEDYTGTGIGWGMTKGLTREFLENLNKDLIKEDFAILLTGHRSESAREAHHIHEQHVELLDKVSKIFVELGRIYGWKTVQIQPTKDATAKLVYEIVHSQLI